MASTCSALFPEISTSDTTMLRPLGSRRLVSAEHSPAGRAVQLPSRHAAAPLSPGPRKPGNC
eukprot:5163063-Lingulodinium_polyedra.AAC.1